MSVDKVEAIAALLARVSGNWYPERTRPALRTINKRHRDVAQLVLAEYDRLSGVEQREASWTASPPDNSDETSTFNFAGDDQLYVGATVVYRPPGEKRALTCRIEKMEHGRAFLAPAPQEIGWVSIQTLSVPGSANAKQ